MRLYDETCLALCEGQYIDIATSELGRAHERSSCYFDMIGRKTAALIAASIEAGALLATDDDDGHRALSRLRLGARASPSSSTTTCSGSGAPEQATGKEPSDVAHRKKTLPVIYACEHAGPEDRARLAELYAHGATRPPARSPRSSRSSSGPAPASTPATRPAATATRRSPSSMPPASSSRAARARLEEIIVSVISA